MVKFKLGKGLLFLAIILSVSSTFAQQQQQRQRQQNSDVENADAKREWYNRSQVEQPGKPVRGDYPEPDDLFDD